MTARCGGRAPGYPLMWTYEDYRAKYDELWPQGWRLKLLDVYVVASPQIS
jgi:hypothetical protein